MDIWTFSAHILLALLCGSIIGAERQWRQHAAGLRTNALICVGAAMYASLSILMDQETSPTRIAGQIVTGIGFLGGGVILKDGLSVKGMTTAATIWCSAAIGTLSGCGFMLHAVIGTVLVLLLNIGFHPLSHWIDLQVKSAKSQEIYYRIKVTCTAQHSSAIRSVLVGYFNTHRKLVLQALSKDAGQHTDQVLLMAECYSTERLDESMEDLIALIQAEEGVNDIRWERN